MTPQDQTIFSATDGTVHGNCLATCVASLLDMDLAQVPPLETMGEDWYLALWEFLRERGFRIHGCRYLGDRQRGGLPEWPADIGPYLPLGPGVDGYYIVGGASPRGVPRGHCVIYKDGVMAHDPHPSRLGLLDLQEVYLIERAEALP